MPELFKGASKLEEIIYQLSIGYLVSFIFYYMVVLIPEIKFKQVFTKYLNHELKRFYIEFWNVTVALQMNSQKSVTAFTSLTEEEIKELFDAANSQDRGNPFESINIPITIGQQIDNLLPYYQKMVNRIALRSRIVDPELDKLLIDFEYSGPLFFFLKTTKFGVISHSLSFVGINYAAQLRQLKKLSEYCYSRYKIPTYETFINTTRKVL